MLVKRQTSLAWDMLTEILYALYIWIFLFTFYANVLIKNILIKTIYFIR